MFNEVEILGKDKFLYKYLNTFGDSARLVLSINDLKKAIKDKLPSFSEKKCLLTKRAFEQCTAEDVANFKASLFRGQSVLVLAGGLGVDDIALSKTFKEVTSIEPDIELNDICEFNFSRLNIKNINRISQKAEEFLERSDAEFDLIYIDPDRRADEQRQILLKDHLPNCIDLMPKLKKISNTIVIKCSPLYDYEQAFKELDNISKMYAISRNGEMKELLIVCNSLPKNQMDCELIAVDIKKDKTLIEQFGSVIKTQSNSNGIGKYLYEAGASIVKLRQFKNYASQLELPMIDASVPYFCSDNLKEKFIGRVFEVVKAFEFSSKIAATYLKALEINKINLKVRGMKYSTESLRKSLKISEGGDDFLFVLPFKGKAMAYHCRKITD